jgi:serine/threonine protein phosphatase PrpC
MRKHPERDHFEVVISGKVAGVSDVGLKHHQNEDFMALGGDQTAMALVVCDGVSNSQNPQEGSKDGAEAARDTILKEVKAGVKDPEELLKAAVIAAQAAVCAVPFQKGLKNAKGEDIDPCQATLVAVLVQGKRITVGWAGDSRAYWIGKSGAQQITHDHSWLNEVLDSGQMTMEQALKDKRAHSITRSLGADANGNNPGIEPSACTLNVSESGRLLVCSDGFWNYADEKKITELVKAHPPTTDALTLARSLVNFARQQGGHDNITVVIATY